MSKKNIFPLYSPADKEKAQPILDELKKKGFQTAAQGDKSAPVLLLLSAAFAADESAQEAFFAADGAGREIIPIDLDGAAQGELVRSALLAKSAIAAQGRTAEEIAARVASAGIFAKRQTPKWIAPVLIAAAVLLVAGAAAWMLFGRAPKNESAPTPEPTPLSQTKARYGLTEEELGKIVGVFFVGDKFYSYTARDYRGRQWDSFVMENWDGGERRYCSVEDGREIPMKHYDDLGLLALMPKLSVLTMINVEADALPSLAGLEGLEQVTLLGCRVGDCEWLADSNVVNLCLQGCDVTDYSPLSSCEKLQKLEIDLPSGAGALVAPPALKSLHLWGSGEELDLSPLQNCTKLEELSLDALPVEELGFLSGLPELNTVTLVKLPRLRDVSALSTLKNLRYLELRELNLTDLSALEGCTGLRSFTMDLHGVHSLDFLSGCSLLSNLHLENAELDDMDFLSAMTKTASNNLFFAGRARDYAGFAQVMGFYDLTLWLDDGNYGALLPYLKDCKVMGLQLGNARDLDLSLLPEVTGRLWLHDCYSLEDFTALEPKHGFYELSLCNLPRLRSLAGLEKIEGFGRAQMQMACRLTVEDCPRLEDWSALDGIKLDKVELSGVYTVPDFGMFIFFSRCEVRLQNIPGLADMSFLDGVSAPKDSYFTFTLLDLEDLRDMSALERFRGEKLVVSPELEAMASALVAKGNFQACEVEYGGAEQESQRGFALLSLEELDTLSDAALKGVTSLCLAGDQIVDRERYDIWDEFDGRTQRSYLVDRASGERTEVKLGGFSDLSAFSSLTGLRELSLYALPIENLEGIQYLRELQSLFVANCPKLGDVSAAFTLQSLQELGLNDSPIASIQGLQNLTELCSLSIGGTKVRDLSPLRLLDLSFAGQRGGFRLSVGGTDCEDYSPVEAIGAFDFLDLNAIEYRRWPDLGRIRQLRGLSASSANGFDQQALEALAQTHPELEELDVCFDRGITDLGPLLALEGLRQVHVSKDMTQAIASLEGRQYGFELRIEG